MVSFRFSKANGRGRSGFTMLEMMFTIAIIFLLASILLPAVQQARECARRYQCHNNLMQIGLALANYESAWERLPQGSVDTNRPIRNVAVGYHVGWVVRILPHMDLKTAYDQFDFSAGVYDKRNTLPLSGMIHCFRCPSSGGGGYSGCHHDVEAPIDIDNSGVLILNRCITREDITDGISNTIYVGETNDGGVFWQYGTRDTLRNTGTPLNAGKAARLPGTAPISARPLSPLYVGGFGSSHAGGANFLFGDGAVRFLSEAISTPIYQQLGHRSDGQLPESDP